MLSHIGPVPAADLNCTAVGWLTAIGISTALACLAAFNRRDLATA